MDDDDYFDDISKIEKYDSDYDSIPDLEEETKDNSFYVESGDDTFDYFERNDDIYHITFILKNAMIDEKDDQRILIIDNISHNLLSISISNILTYLNKEIENIHYCESTKITKNDIFIGDGYLVFLTKCKLLKKYKFIPTAYSLSVQNKQFVISEIKEDSGKKKKERSRKSRKSRRRKLY